MRIQLGFIGLLVVLFVVLAMTRPSSYLLGSEGYAATPNNNEMPDSGTVFLLVMLFLILGPVLFGILLR